MYESASTQTVYVHVYGNNNRDVSTSYDLTVERGANDRYEPNSNYPTLGPGTYSDLTLLDNENDYYALSVEEGETVNVVLTVPKAADGYEPDNNPELQLVGPDGNILEEGDERSEPADETIRHHLMYESVSAQTVYVRVYGNSDREISTSYDLSINPDSAGSIGALVVDSQDPDRYDSIQAAVNAASDGETVEVRPGTYREQITLNKDITLVAPEGATIDGSSLGGIMTGIRIPSGSSASPTVDGFVVTGYATGIDASDTSGAWTVRDVTIRQTTGDGVDAFDSTGEWTIHDTRVFAANQTGVEAGFTTGDWTIRDSQITGSNHTGVSASGSVGDWEIRDTVVTDNGLDGVDGSGSGDWVVRGSVITDNGLVGVDGSYTEGNWTVDDSVISRNGGLFASLVDARFTNGTWTVSESTLTNPTGTGPALNATDSSSTGDATRNWWGAADGPSGDFSGSGVAAAGNVAIRPYYTDAGLTTLSDAGSQEPFGGTPSPLPGEIDATDFDLGGEGIAYHETTPKRLDDSGFRPDASVDIESPLLGGTGDGSIGYVEEGEWLEYTVEAAPGTYRLSLAVASRQDGELTASIDGREIGSVRETTGGWHNFAETEAGEFTIEESGEHTIRIESTEGTLNLDRLVVSEAGAPSAQRSYSRTPPSAPGEIDASHFDVGGEGISYHENSVARLDDSWFRPDVTVDIEAPSKGGSGDGSIGYVEPGEWVEYTVEAEPGTYTLSLAVASSRGGELMATVDGRDIGAVSQDTDGWHNFTEAEVGEFTIDESGEHTIRIVATRGTLNFDHLVVDESETAPTREAYGETAPTLPGEIDASHFDLGGEGVAYHDDEAARRDNSGFRPDAGVDVEAPTKGGTGDGSIGYVEEGEWVEYTVDADPGTYELFLAVASQRDGELTASIDGQDIGRVTENPGSWYDFVEVEVGSFTVEETGEHTIRIESSGGTLNFDRLIVERGEPDST
jgi:hypothetical protein